MSDMKTAEQVDEMRELLRVYRDVTYDFARYGGAEYNVVADVDQHTGFRLPVGVARECLGAIRGLLEAKLIALGCDPTGVTEKECFECSGTGTKDARDHLRG